MKFIINNPTFYFKEKKREEKETSIHLTFQVECFSSCTCIDQVRNLNV